MPRQSKIEISLGLGYAMRELKDSGVLHCDIKPANTVLHVTTDDGARTSQRVLKLIDFGEALGTVSLERE